LLARPACGGFLRKGCEVPALAVALSIMMIREVSNPRFKVKPLVDKDSYTPGSDSSFQFQYKYLWELLCIYKKNKRREKRKQEADAKLDEGHRESPLG